MVRSLPREALEALWIASEHPVINTREESVMVIQELVPFAYLVGLTPKGASQKLARGDLKKELTPEREPIKAFITI